MDYKLTPKRKSKIGELIVIKKLIDLGFDVYDNIVDDRWIDLIIRIERKGKIYHQDIQVKFSKLYVNYNIYWFGISRATFQKYNKFYLLFVIDDNRIFIIPYKPLSKILENVIVDKKGNGKLPYQ